MTALICIFIAWVVLVVVFGAGGEPHANRLRNSFRSSTRFNRYGDF